MTERMTLPRIGILIAVLLTALFAAKSMPASAVSADVNSLTPNFGPLAGGTTVTISGEGFGTPGTPLVTTVTFDGTPGTALQVLNDNTLTIVSPAHAAGTVNVIVNTDVPSTPASAAADDFTYAAAGPVITSLSPSGGPITGGTTVTITGTGFTNVEDVTFDGATVPFVPTSTTTIVATAPAHAAGAVRVAVTTDVGTSANTAADDYTYGATGPTVTGLNPTGGPITGGNLVVITGTGFGTSGSPLVTGISFGGTAVTTFVVNGNTQITATAPAHAAGNADVLVTTGSGTSANTAADNYTYGTGATITAVTPGSGTTAGGNTVIITGTGFTGATALTFGGTAATTFIINGDTQITATAPAHAAGTVDVVVTTPVGTNANTTADNYVYTAGPIVTDVAPATGSTAGGTSVVITGVNLTGATAVTFGGTAATSFVVNSGTQITAVAPAKATGTYDVIVTTPLGISVNTTDDDFTYGAGPTITSISPSTGVVAGGTSVTITGTGFNGATAVLFGTTAATSFTVVSDTSITAVAPAGTAGVVSIRVTTPLGQTADTANDNFTYGSGTTTTTFTLYFRWTLIVWSGKDNANIATTLAGQETPDNPATNNVSGVVTAIFHYNNPQQKFEGFFPGSANVPGANDFTTFQEGEAYWIAISQSGSLSWTVLTD